MSERVKMVGLEVLSDNWYVACAGLLDEDDPAACIRRETEEETGYRLRDVHKVFDAYMSPASVTERLFFFLGAYSPHDQVFGRRRQERRRAHRGARADTLRRWR